jgi:hypothetical protein
MTGDHRGYEYDALGRRIEKIDSIAATTTQYYYDGWQALCEYEGTTRREFVYGNYLDEALLMVATVDSTSTEYYYAHDHLYSHDHFYYLDPALL